jgi:hypothetical protein
MSRSRYPTANSIFEAAAKHGIAVRINYIDGRIASIETKGKVTDGVPENDANPWDDVLENQKTPS